MRVESSMLDGDDCNGQNKLMTVLCVYVCVCMLLAWLQLIIKSAHRNFIHWIQLELALTMALAGVTSWTTPTMRIQRQLQQQQQL